ncbi:hypothetical protein TDB9533_02038 [Thalassocella blandensis]|nr:hypothetical protein TDB9533_02038 [Thalassocella blandensis]
MTDNSSPVSKVLVHDCDRDKEAAIKQFCDDNQLVALKASSNNVLDVLRSYVDLGGVFLSEDLDGEPGAGIKLGEEIHRIRPELPIFLRINSESSNIEDPKKAFCATYTIESIDTLKTIINEYIFCTYYPNALIRGIEEITCDTLHHFFDNVDINVSAPYLVKDRIIFGELFSLIPVESCWCKGYMTLQSEEGNVRKMVKAEKLNEEAGDVENFRVINDVLSEITNMAWGTIRNRFISENCPASDVKTQVPIIVNHKNKYITFGTNTPQLCFKYTLSRPEGASFSLYIKFVFNLHWAPEKFSENQPSVNELVTSGELEFF